MCFAYLKQSANFTVVGWSSLNGNQVKLVYTVAQIFSLHNESFCLYDLLIYWVRAIKKSDYNYGFICFSFQICQFLLHVFWSYPVGGDTLSEFSSWWIDLFIISFFFLLWSLLSDVTIVNSPFVLITVYMVFHHLFICDLFVSLYFSWASYKLHIEFCIFI